MAEGASMTRRYCERVTIHNLTNAPQCIDILRSGSDQVVLRCAVMPAQTSAFVRDEPANGVIRFSRSEFSEVMRLPGTYEWRAPLGMEIVMRPGEALIGRPEIDGVQVKFGYKPDAL
jgi:hypothetical protein